MDVPIPCARSPPNLFSRKLATANPTILQQHPIVAAPAASPDRFRITPSAAELIGKVRIIPIRTETTIPMINGCCSVPQLIRDPSHSMNFDIGGPTRIPTAEPAPIDTSGVSKISSFVFAEINIPISIATNAATNAPNGSPGPDNTIAPSFRTSPDISFEAKAPTIPAVAADTMTS